MITVERAEPRVRLEIVTTQHGKYRHIVPVEGHLKQGQPLPCGGAGVVDLRRTYVLRKVGRGTHHHPDNSGRICLPDCPRCANSLRTGRWRRWDFDRVMAS